MSKLRLRISMSFDGFVAGPNQSSKEPLGIGGERLHDWVFRLAAWRAPHGMEGGEVNESTRSWMNRSSTSERRSWVATCSAASRRVGPRTPWNGWWGDNPPFHHPVFVLTHHPREPLMPRAGPRSPSSPTGSNRRSTRRAGRRGKDVTLAGGASGCSQYFTAGLVDEMEFSVVPILLGSGRTAVRGRRDDLHGLRLVRTVATPR